MCREMSISNACSDRFRAYSRSSMSSVTIYLCIFTRMQKGDTEKNRCEVRAKKLMHSDLQKEAMLSLLLLRFAVLTSSICGTHLALDSACAPMVWIFCWGRLHIRLAQSAGRSSRAEPFSFR